MAFSHSMWLSQRLLVVVSVFMMPFLWSAEAAPQEHINDPADCSAGVSLITERTSGKAQCVPFHRCCDTKEEMHPFLGLINERTPTGEIKIDISTTGNNQKCKGKLELCCRCVDNGLEPTTEKKTLTCGKRNINGVQIRVTGFKEGQTQQGEFPWMVAVMTKDTEFVGGGSLVHPRVVLTAGHKVFNKTSDNLVARIGDWDILNTIESIAPQNINVEEILYHPDFKRISENNVAIYNVAILVLKAAAKCGETVAPVCLPDPGQNFNGNNCFVTGWGKNDFGKEENYQTIMKKVEVPIVDHSRCQTMLRENTELPSDFVLHSSNTCAGGDKADACEGDGGSPLVCPNANNQLVQVGVVSWGIGCGIVGNPGVYGSVIKSITWIHQTIQNKTRIITD